VGCLIQSRRFAISPQNPSGSLTDRSYMARYLALSQWLFFAHCGSTGITSDIAPSPLLDAREGAARPWPHAKLILTPPAGATTPDGPFAAIAGGRGAKCPIHTHAVHSLAHNPTFFPTVLNRLWVSPGGPSGAEPRLPARRAGGRAGCLLP